MSASGPNIQLELRLAEMARMNEEIRRRHLEVEADKRRAQRTGGMVTRDQSITMATAMPTDFDASREDGFKDGLDSRPLPADPYGKDRVPRDKRGKPQDKMSKNSKKKQTIDEARQRGMADQEYWRQEQARADAARIKRAQGRDGTWRREWDREKNQTDERESFRRNDKTRDKFRRSEGQVRRHENVGGIGGGRYRRNDQIRRKNHRPDFQESRHGPMDNPGVRTRRGSTEEFHRFPTSTSRIGSRFSDRKKRQFERKNDRNELIRETDTASERDQEHTNERPRKDNSDEDNLKEYSSDESRRRKTGSRCDDDDEDENEDNEIQLPPSIESSRSDASDYDENDEIDTEILEALQAQKLDPTESDLDDLGDDAQLDDTVKSTENYINHTKATKEIEDQKTTTDMVESTEENAPSNGGIINDENVVKTQESDDTTMP